MKVLCLFHTLKGIELTNIYPLSNKWGYDLTALLWYSMRVSKMDSDTILDNTQYLYACFHSYDFMQEACRLAHQTASLQFVMVPSCSMLCSSYWKYQTFKGWRVLVRYTPLLFLPSGVVVGIIFVNHLSTRLLLVQCSQFAFVCIYYIYISVTLLCLSEPLLSYCLPTQQAFFTALH